MCSSSFQDPRETMFGSSFQHSQSAFFTRIPLQCNTSQASLTHPAAVPKEYDYEVAKYLREKLHMEATIKLSESETEVARITVRTPISLPSSARLCLACVVLITVKRCNKVSANFFRKKCFLAQIRGTLADGEWRAAAPGARRAPRAPVCLPPSACPCSPHSHAPTVASNNATVFFACRTGN